MNIKINLLPDIILQQRREARLKQILDASLVAWMALVGLAVGIVFLVVSISQSSLESLQAQQQEIDSVVNSEANVAFRLEAQQVQTALNSVGSVLVDPVKPHQILNTLAASMPSDAAIKEITITDDKLITLQGTATNYEVVAQVAAGLNASEDLYKDNSELGYFDRTTIQQAVASDETVYSFTINTYYFPPSEATQAEVEESPLQQEPTEQQQFEDLQQATDGEAN